MVLAWLISASWALFNRPRCLGGFRGRGGRGGRRGRGRGRGGSGGGGDVFGSCCFHIFENWGLKVEIRGEERVGCGNGSIPVVCGGAGDGRGAVLECGGTNSESLFEKRKTHKTLD